METKRKGVTLVELLIVIAIVAISIIVFVPSPGERKKAAKRLAIQTASLVEKAEKDGVLDDAEHVGNDTPADSGRPALLSDSLVRLQADSNQSRGGRLGSWGRSIRGELGRLKLQ